MTFTLREYEPADFETLWQVDQLCFSPGIAYSRRELMTYIARRNSFTLVAEEGGGNGATRESSGILGFITADAGRGRVGHIITIDVVERARRSGVGSSLLEAAEQQLCNMGCDLVGLETAVDNLGAFAFYKRHGYFLVKTIPHYYATGVDAFVLKKSLRSPVSTE